MDSFLRLDLPILFKIMFNSKKSYKVITPKCEPIAFILYNSNYCADMPYTTPIPLIYPIVLLLYWYTLYYTQIILLIYSILLPLLRPVHI